MDHYGFSTQKATTLLEYIGGEWYINQKKTKINKVEKLSNT